MGREVRRAWSIAAIVGVGLLAAGCQSVTTEADRARFAAERAEDLKKPMSQWNVVMSFDDVAAQTPERLLKDDAAILVTRGRLALQDSVPFLNVGQSGQYSRRNPTVAGLQRVGTSTGGRLLGDEFKFLAGVKGGNEADKGFSMAVVSPGEFALSYVGVKQVDRAEIRRSAIGVMLAAAAGDKVTVKAGEVVYVGSITAFGSTASFNKERPSFSVEDESADARGWLQRHMPNFAGKMTTRLIPCATCTLSRDDTDPAQRKAVLDKALDNLLSETAKPAKDEPKAGKDAPKAGKTKPAP